ncbi:MAG TPA: VOC family protein [Luteibaculaceae bacterium]|jgi:PhnB protein|nr:VOC family protein [Luteibaculaceae bacterium]
MANVSVYLNFAGNCEEAFNHYRQIFRGEFTFPFSYMRDMPGSDVASSLPEHEQGKVMHVGLSLFNGFQLMGCDMLESMGHKLVVGNNTVLNLELDSKEEADRLYQALATQSSECVAPQEQFWGYWGVCIDKFGIRWMFNVMNPTT